MVFHRDGLHVDGLVCHRTASFPTGVVRVVNDDELLDYFALLVAGFVIQDVAVDKTIRAEWLEVCRALGGREELHPDYLLFSSPNVMVAFDQVHILTTEEDRKSDSGSLVVVEAGCKTGDNCPQDHGGRPNSAPGKSPKRGRGAVATRRHRTPG